MTFSRRESRGHLHFDQNSDHFFGKVGLVTRIFGNGMARTDPWGGGGTWVFFGWVFAARDFKLAPRSKKNFP